MRRLLRDLGVGKIAYKYFYKPIMAPARFHGSRGFIEIPLTYYGEYDLKRRLNSLQPPSFPKSNLKLVFLTGKRYYHQTILCALSLIYAIKAIPTITIYDDGSLTNEMGSLLQKLLPGSFIVNEMDCQSCIEAKLPENEYTHLRFLRDKSVLMRKLIDINLITPGQIYLDSDMIFWGIPSEIFDFYQSGTPFFMHEQYNCKDLGLICGSEVIFNQTGITPLRNFNSGIFYTGDIEIAWDLIESLARQLLPLPTERFFLFEQTLYALLFAKIPNAVRLPESYYVAYSSLPDKPTIVTHYVTSMKIPYMNREWYRRFRNFSHI